MPKLVPNWRDILKYAWSVRLMMASQIVALAAGAWALLAGRIDQVLFAAGTFVLGALAIFFRVVSQGLTPPADGAGIPNAPAPAAPATPEEPVGNPDRERV